jgi:serine/threonine protein kinase/formylglycine-generating enzyme required for sulfatase activity/dienelactone hydrolase
MKKPEQLAEELFEEALELRPEQRTAFLESACRDHPELRGVVASLLREDARLTGFLGEPIYLPAAAPLVKTGAGNARPAPGTRLGRYRVLELLGTGGMGVVYRAHDEKLERTVAIKVLAPGMLDGDEARRHFRREALALAKLNHPNIAAVYDVGEQDGTDYIVMECVPGESLAARLKAGPLAVKDCTAIALQVAEALEQAHEQGVVHRDLKPANVMVTPKGVAKVLDFGLAKLLAPAAADATVSFQESGRLLGTPLYMSPEQVRGVTADARSDLWSLGVLYYEALAGRPPFSGENTPAVLRAITEKTPPRLRGLRAEVPAQAEEFVACALRKDPAKRTQSAGEAARELSALLLQMTTSIPTDWQARRVISRWSLAAMGAAVAALLAAGSWLYHRAMGRQWASEEAIPSIKRLVEAHHPLAAFVMLKKAQHWLPADPQLRQLAEAETTAVSVTSDPDGARVEIQDYLTPDGPWYRLGSTPLRQVSVPAGYFRWRVTKPGAPALIEAPETGPAMHFALAEVQSAPPGMTYSPGGEWTDSIGFVGWVGPYQLPPYDIDRYEVTNAEYQRFVDSGGYSKRQYWPQHFPENGRELRWEQAVARFRDATDRPGPSTWAGGHYPDGQAQLPVSGVSWFEASAYAAWAGKRLPVLAQFYQAAPADLDEYTAAASNISRSAPSAVGTYKGVGPFGTYDMAGNVREWIANPVDDDRRMILGGSWRSPSYLSSSPEALSSFDRSDTDGFRCVRNLGPVPAAAEAPVHGLERDFAKYKPVSDDVFRAYQLLYAYPPSPLNAKVEGVVKETTDWREEKVTFDAAYDGERMAAYLFLPRNVRPPYQTVLFFPSARVMFLPDNSRELGDIKFFDYILQSGRAVVYPIYEDTYERRIEHRFPGGGQDTELTADWYKDAARTLDYLATRPDIDDSRIAYLGVSMGAADGVILATLLQDRLKAAVFLDGGYFLDQPPRGGDQADFAPRMKKPVLMVNGRYDFTFPVDKAQDPLFAMLGTPADEKRHVILDTPHDVTERRGQLVKEVLDWLDRYLGRVDS